MTKPKQFWALLKFQMMAAPILWIVAIYFAVPLFIAGSFPVTYHPNLESVLRVRDLLQNLFIVGALGVWTLAPEMAPSGRSITSLGTEFLLTRAIDRPILYRSRTALLYFFVFLVPLASLVYSLKSSDLRVAELSPLAQQECLTIFPGSTLLPNPSGRGLPLISLSRGALLVEEWYCWRYALSVLGIQVLLSLLYPFKHRTLIFFTILVALTFTPLALALRRTNADFPSSTERWFFSFAAHPGNYWIPTVVSLVLCQLWCEWRFRRLDQPS